MFVNVSHFICISVSTTAVKQFFALIYRKCCVATLLQHTHIHTSVRICV